MVPRVLHIVLGLNTGGLEKFVSDLVRLQNKTVMPEILCLSAGNGGSEFLPDAPVTRWGNREGVRPALAFKIARHVRAKGFHLVHTHNPSPHLYGAVAGRLAGVPVVHTKHGRNYPKNNRKVWLNRIATLCSDRIVAVSRDAENVCRDVEKVPERKLRTILNGIDIDTFIPLRSGLLRSALGCGADTPLVGIVARLSPEKQHSLLLDAFQFLHKNQGDCRLVVIGDGVLRGELERLARNRGLSGRVFFLGNRSDVADLIPDLDVFVLSSRTEGISLTLLEAMSCELPVVATDVGGNPEVVVDGVTGYIVPQDAQVMADRIEDLIRNPEKRKQMGKAGRQRVVEHFSIQRAADQYYELYREVLAQRGRLRE
ncbi:MAG: glycosyltransferase [Geothermobacteraceae bacterium]